jgi:hypothetical protein
MSEASRTWSQLTLLDWASDISSPVSPDGVSRSGTPVCPTMPTSGPEAVRAKVSATPGSASGSPTPGICGPSGSGSSASAALQSSLASRLRAHLDSRGSTLFTLTWKERATPSGLRICALRASARRTDDNGCSSWPTPTVSRGDYSRRNGNPDEPTLKLSGVAKLASWHRSPWVTPKAQDGERGGQAKRAAMRGNLVDQVKLSSWATPAAHEAGGTPEQFLERKRRANANGSSLGVSLTSLSMQAQTTGSPATGSHAPTESRGQLNPEHTRWLMGFPAGWGSYADTETRFRRK